MSETLRIGSLFSGYGGLERAILDVIGGHVVWHSEIEPLACRVLAHHWPDTPNLGDVTGVDWVTVPRVDVLTGGFPCQDVSSAGMRLGMRPDTRSGLWSHMAYAIDLLRPRLVVIENVRGLLSADAACDLEPCPWCVGDDEGRPLRALGRVLGDLADLGFDARWCGLRAADVGAPHGRFRVFITAWPASDTNRQGWEGTEPADAALGCEPTAADAPGCGDTYQPGGCDAEGLPVGAVAGPGAGGGSGRAAEGGHELDGDATLVAWGDYGPAVRRWELILGRPAPAPTQTGTRGGRQLSALFVEWLMGLPAGWVTDVPGLSRNEQLKLLSNGVVPQQCAAAVRWLLRSG